MLAATLLCLASLTQAGPERSGVIRGVVIEKGTHRPLAGVSVRSSDEPDAPTVTTNERGEFDRLPVGKGNPVPFDGQPGPSVRVRAEDDRAWPWEVVEPVSLVRNTGGQLRTRVIEALYRLADTRWKGQGAEASLVVECPSVGVIEAVLRGPDGAPLADCPIHVTPTIEFPQLGAGVIRFSGRTDRQGTLRLRAFDDLRRLDVRVPGLGSGSTGRIEVVGGKVSVAEIPPLIRFARIDGKLASTLTAPGAAVALLSEPFRHPIGPAVPCDAQGKFTLVDLVPGTYRLVARRDGRDLRMVSRVVEVAPGQRVTDMVLQPAPPPSPDDQKRTGRTLRLMNGDRKTTITWVEGTIRDEKGQPLPGASVFLYLQYHGGLRFYEEVKKTVADDRGRYKFEGPLYPSMQTLTVVAAANGRTPTVAYAPGPDAALKQDELKPAQLDLTTGSRGASVSVTVLQDGKARPGVPVRLSAWGKVGLTHDPIAVPEHSPVRDEAEALLTPKATTGPDGVVRFTNLLPGAFELTAGVHPEFRWLRQRAWGNQPESVFGTNEGIAAPPGGRIEATITVHRQPAPVRFRILKPDGSPIGRRTIGFGFRCGKTNAATLRKFDAEGIGHHDFEEPGLWRVRIRFGDGEVDANHVWKEPFYQAVALIPVSPGLALDEPVTLRTIRREPGSIRARLLDAEGQPARGTVMIFNDRGEASLRATTVGADGTARFANLPSGKYRLRGAVEGQPPAPRYHPGDPPPDDAALQGHATVFDRELVLASGAAASVDLRLEPVGYVRAVIGPPAGRSPAQYSAALVSAALGDEVRDQAIDREAGVYLFGPVRSGSWPIVLREMRDAGPAPKRWDRPVVVVPGQVVRVEVAPDPSPPRSKEPKLFEPGPDRFAATVLLADGLTPAFGARALYIPPGEREASVEGIADGSGRLTWKPRWSFSQPSETGEGPEPVKEPTVVAWMPGLAGPVVAVPEPEKPLRLVLPAPAGVAGRVTLGGRGIGGRNARVQVVAAAEGRGALAIAFGREVTADPDGRFQFAGLAPGRYVVQAARDNIWLSRSVALVVESGKEAAPIDLDIPEPGATIALDLVDDRDRPVVGRSFSIVRPEGPLASALPMRYRTDERGSAIVRGLETGPQSLIADGDPRPRAFTVSPARPGLSPQAIRIGGVRPIP